MVINMFFGPFLSSNSDLPTQTQSSGGMRVAEGQAKVEILGIPLTRSQTSLEF